MKKYFLFFYLFLCLIFNTLAQNTDHAWLETSQLKVRINADGRLFCDDEKGAFLVPKGDSMVSLMRGAGLWFGGIDPGNNLFISAQTPDPVKTDFAAGFRDIPNSGRVWKVTREEIHAHWKDYLDNWIIDDPNPAIYGWPGKDNPFFHEYNGFSLPDSMAQYAVSAINLPTYRPDKGDSPVLNTRFIDSEWNLPSQMVCFVFNSDAPQLLSKSYRPFPVQVWGQAFVYDCPENDFLNRSVFVHYSWRNDADYRFDSSRVSLFNDVDLGDPEDDYHGFLPGRSAHFTYNADSLDEVWDTKTPLFFVDIVMRAQANEYNAYFEAFESTWNQLEFMPLGLASGSPGMREPANPHEFYNYMTGTWSDGTPLTNIGNGYSHGNPDFPVKIAFPGYPDSIGLWTELNANNAPGNRKALINQNTGTALPQQINEMLVQYTYMPWEQGTLTERIKHWESEQENLWDQLYCCIDFFTNPPPPIGCESSSSALPQPAPYTISPNPANEAVRVWHPGIYLKKMLLLDAIGRLMEIGEYRDQYSEVSVKNLPAGIYFLQIEDETGEKHIEKIIVTHW